MKPTSPDSKNEPLQEQIREAGLESIAATLASIHLAKQMRERERSSPSGRSQGLSHDVRIPVHDLLHGLAQLQVEFVQRLLSFNRDATGRIRKALLDSDLENDIPIEAHGASKGCVRFSFQIVNRATTTRVLNLRNHGLPEHAIRFTPASPITLAAGDAKTVTAACTDLPPGVHRGCVAVESRGLRVSLVRYTLTLT